MTHLNTRTGGFKNGPEQGGVGIESEHSPQLFTGGVEIQGVTLEAVSTEQVDYVTGGLSNIPAGFRGSVGIIDQIGVSRASDFIVTAINDGEAPWPVGLILESFLASDDALGAIFTNVSAGILGVPAASVIRCIRYRFE